MIMSSEWLGWRTHLVMPFFDAAFRRTPESPALEKHARSYPGSVAESDQAARQASIAGFAVDGDWQRRRILAGALDRQDNFARLLGIRIASARRLDRDGEWPRGRFVALGLHWGAGFPVLEHMLDSGHQPAFVYRPENPADLGCTPHRIFDRLHLRALRGFGHCIPVGGAYRRIVDALDAGRVPVVLFDAPPGPSSRVVRLERSCGEIILRVGLFRLLAEKQVPVVFFRCGQQVGARRRRLEIGPVVAAGQADELAARAADYLLETLDVDSAQWHLWPVADQVIGKSVRPDEPEPGAREARS